MRGPQEQEDQGRPPSHPQRPREVVTARLSPSCSPLGMDVTFRASLSSPIPGGQQDRVELDELVHGESAEL